MTRSARKPPFSGLLYRFGLWTRLWLKSPFGWLVMALAFAVVKMAADNSARGPETASFVYEKVAILLAAVVVMWALSLDFDSGWIRQIWTLPQGRGLVLAERFGFGMLLFMLLMVLISVYMQINFGPNVWKILLFIMPVYLAIGAWTVLWAVVVRHSSGGLMAALAFWAFAVSGAELGEYSPVITHFTGVFRSVVTYGSASSDPWDRWVVFNRCLYAVAFAFIWLVTLVAVRRRY